MELATTVNFVARTLAQRASAGTGLAPRASPIRAVEPWFSVAFHYPQLSTIDGVLLYLKMAVI